MSRCDNESINVLTADGFLRVMQKLGLFCANFSKVEIIDKAHDRVQSTINVCLIYSYLADAKQGFLPQIVFITLGDRYIELVADASFNFPQHGAFVFERVTLCQIERQPQYSHDHEGTSDSPLYFLRSRLQATQDLLEFVGLDHISSFDILEVLQADATFSSCRNFTDVVLETTQAGNTALMDNSAVTHHTGLGSPYHPAFADYAASHRTNM
jgi:hypothetical protein